MREYRLKSFYLRPFRHPEWTLRASWISVPLAGGEMADEDMREMVDAIEEAKLIAKKNNKKDTPKKYRKDE